MKLFNCNEFDQDDDQKSHDPSDNDNNKENKDRNDDTKSEEGTPSRELTFDRETHEASLSEGKYERIRKNG